MNRPSLEDDIAIKKPPQFSNVGGDLAVPFKVSDYFESNRVEQSKKCDFSSKELYNNYIKSCSLLLFLQLRIIIQ